MQHPHRLGGVLLGLQATAVCVTLFDLFVPSSFPLRPFPSLLLFPNYCLASLACQRPTMLRLPRGLPSHGLDGGPGSCTSESAWLSVYLFWLAPIGASFLFYADSSSPASKSKRGCEVQLKTACMWNYPSLLCAVNSVEDEAV